LKGSSLAIRLKTRHLKKGVHLPEYKPTANLPVEPAPLPEKVAIPLQGTGGSLQLLVRRGDRVLTGQKIADSENWDTTPVHASLSGEVSASIQLIDPTSGHLTEALVITSDGKDNWVKLYATSNPEELSPNEILERIRQAGVVDADRGTLFTHAKLNTKKNRKIDTVILSACLCEPYVTTDYRIMMESGHEVLAGLGIVRKLLSTDSAYIAIEKSRWDIINHIEKQMTVSQDDSRIIPIEAKYPASERALVEGITGRGIPHEGQAEDAGVVIIRASTAKAIFDAVFRGKPSIEQVVTVTGAIKHPKNLLARLGTTLAHLIAFCGGMQQEASKVITGGSMTGIAHHDLGFPLTKGVSCILVQENIAADEHDCIRCGRCLEVCPRCLSPTLLARCAKAGLFDQCRQVYITSCDECGSCAYVCPANIPLVQYIRIAKTELAKKVVKT
jgi:electron transport complex protein RnfC